MINLTNTILYAKGWYKKSDNIIEDLKKILELDGYTPFNKNDIYSILLGRIEKHTANWATTREILSGIHPKNCWKVGYEFENEKDYDMCMAFIYYIISNLRFVDNREWTSQMPLVTKYQKADHVTINSLYQHFIKNKVCLLS
jgi:hypothetical protein